MERMKNTTNNSKAKITKSKKTKNASNKKKRILNNSNVTCESENVEYSGTQNLELHLDADKLEFVPPIGDDHTIRFHYSFFLAFRKLKLINAIFNQQQHNI